MHIHVVKALLQGSCLPGAATAPACFQRDTMHHTLERTHMHTHTRAHTNTRAHAHTWNSHIVRACDVWNMRAACVLTSAGQLLARATNASAYSLIDGLVGMRGAQKPPASPCPLPLASLSPSCLPSCPSWPVGPPPATKEGRWACLRGKTEHSLDQASPHSPCLLHHLHNQHPHHSYLCHPYVKH